VKSTKRKSSRVSLGRTTWWTAVEQTALDPPSIRPPSQADGSVVTWAPATWTETQVTESENHPTWKSRKRGDPGDIGGDFYTQKKSVSIETPQVLVWERYNAAPIGSPPIWVREHRYGPLLAFNPYTGIIYPSASSSSDSALSAWGAKAIAQCKPTNSVADLSTFLGEVVREGVPKLIGASLWKDKAKAGRKMPAEEFLNYQFGWKPIANEISATALAIWRAETTMRQFQRDSGKNVRRRFEFPSEYTRSVDTVWDQVPATDLGYSSGRLYKPVPHTGRVVRTREVFRRRWFSGQFTYHLPSSGNTYDSMARSALMAKKTLGLSLTPDTVWNLAPWSWAVDWFTNAGDVISNLTDWAVYGLCLRYGYIMEHTIARDTYTYVGGSKGAGFKRTEYLPPPIILEVETKIRRKANPFGFGLTWNGLSPIQLAIAAALGITRS
jgi:hypothetical protein